VPSRGHADSGQRSGGAAGAGVANRASPARIEQVLRNPIRGLAGARRSPRQPFALPLRGRGMPWAFRRATEGAWAKEAGSQREEVWRVKPKWRDRERRDASFMGRKSGPRPAQSETSERPATPVGSPSAERKRTVLLGSVIMAARDWISPMLARSRCTSTWRQKMTSHRPSGARSRRFCRRKLTSLRAMGTARRLDGSRVDISAEDEVLRTALAECDRQRLGFLPGGAAS
jgi:hypothetical protein